MARKQRTLAGETTLSGVGLHTGNMSTITFKPAPEGTGYVFVRTDLEGAPSVPALVDHVVELARGTTIALGEARVHTVEHVLAALVGMGVDNCFIELTNNEPPVGDGSSLPFVEMIKSVGVLEQTTEREEFVIDSTIRYIDEKRGTEIVALPNPEYRVTVMVDYNNPALGSQHTGLFNLEAEFEREFASARTFCFLHEVEMLHAQGLIQGGNLDNAIVIVDQEMSDEELRAKLSGLGIEGNAILGTSGILNDNRLRYRNEPARHKLLDMIGDLALVGVPIRGQLLAARPGHASNIEMAKLLRREYLKQREAKPKRMTSGVVYDINQILKIMPHRWPFLLVDRVTHVDLESNTVTGIKNVTFNEPQFLGHFPERPIFPGVLIVEAMAQVGCMMLVSRGVTFGDKLVFFTGINNVKFRKPVVPGDQLVMQLTLTRHRFNIVNLVGKAYVDDQVVAEGEFTAAIVDKEVAS
jgi:UDP-3-O-[3-hydroxymyristoyl] N-acetylglucosamine deacetylase/3-hydroxyacyl-[acyl-carrier-protein] dehydratase